MKTVRHHLFPALALAALLGTCLVTAVRANTEKDILTTATALDSGSSYQGGGPAGSSNDLTFTASTYANTTFTLNSTALSAATLDDLDATQALTISASQQLTLNGGINSVPGTAPGDLLYLATGANLTYSGAGGIALLASGNFDLAGTAQANIGTAISGGFAIAKTGTGTLTLSGVNTYTGGTTFAGGVVNASNRQALGTAGSLVFSGGTLQYGAGNQSDYSNRFSTAANQAYSIDTNGQNVSYNTGLTSSGGTLTKLGAGTLTLLNPGTYAGSTTFAGGILNASVAQALGTGSLIFSGGTLQYGSANSSDYSARFSTAANQAYSIDTDNGKVTYATALTSSGGTLAKLGAGTLTLTGNSTYTGTTTITGGTLQVGNNGTTGTLGAGPVIDNGILAFSRSDNFTLANAIGGTGSLTQAAGDTLTLTGANTYTGTTTISSGTLQVGNGGAAGTLGTGTVTDNSALVFNRSDNLTVANVINGSGSLTQAGTGTLTLTSTNNYQGTTTFAGGGINVSNRDALGVGKLVFSGGTLQYGGTNHTDYSARFSTAANQAYSVDTNGQNVTFATALTSSGGSLTKLGNGTLTLTGTNTYTGGTTFAGGVLNATNAQAFGTTGSLFFSGGTLQYGGNNTTDYSGRFSTADNQAYSIDTNGQNVTFATGLTSSGGTLTKLGVGTLILTGTNTYTATTTINAGTLILGDGINQVSLAGNYGATVSNNGLAGDDAVTVNLGASFRLQVNASVNGGRGGGGGGAGDFGTSPAGSGGTGGAGVNNASNTGTFLNGGSITGGNGGNAGSDPSFGSGGTGGNGGVGANFSLGGSWNNAGFILGGSGGAGGNSYYGDHGTGGNGAAGVSFLLGGGLTNSGSITGGGGSYGGNSYYISGGAGGNGGAGVNFSANGSLTNAGSITGGSGGIAGGAAYGNGGNGGNGGTGVSFLANGSLTNTGSITGGNGGTAAFAAYGNAGNGGNGAAGVSIAGSTGTFLNNASINGGIGGIGGDSANSSQAGNGGNGGVGVSFLLSSSLTNAGSIAGGTGGNGGGAQYGSGGTGGTGGAGVSFPAGGSLTNTGFITGGNGGSGGVGNGNQNFPGPAGSAGAGVVFSGGSGSLINQSGGTIIGGVLMDGNFANQVTLQIGGTIIGGLNMGGNSGSTLTLTDNGTGGTQLYSLGVQGGTSIGSLVKSGSGTWTLDQPLSYTGSTTFAGGVLNASNAQAFGSGGTLIFSGGTLQYGGTNGTDYSPRFSTAANQVYSIDTNGGLIYFNAALTSSGGSLTKLGDGTLILLAASTYTGSTTFAGGFLNAVTPQSFGSGGSLDFSGGTLQYGGNNTTDYSGRFSTAANQAYSIDTHGQNVTFATALTSSGGTLTKLGAGTLTLTVANTYTGGTTFAGGNLNASDPQAFGTTGSLVFSGGTLQYSASNQSDYSARFSTAANQAYSIDTNGQNVTFATALTSSGGTLTKLGAGTLTLAVANTYTSGTTFAGGVLSASNAQAFGSTGSFVFSGGTLQYGGSNQSDYSARFSTAANQAYSIDTNGQNVTFATGLTSSGGTLTKLGAGTLTLTGTNTYTGTTTINAGTLILGDGTSAASFIGYSPGANDGTAGSAAVTIDNFIASGAVVTVNNAPFQVQAQASVTGGNATANTTGANYGRGGNGGAGVSFAASGTLTNAGSVTGGTGGVAGLNPNVSGYSGSGGNGGTGVGFAAGGTLTNAGSVAGGTGGLGGSYPGYGNGGGYGGTGVSLSVDGTLLETGTLFSSGSITAGIGGYGGSATSGAYGGGGGLGLHISYFLAGVTTTTTNAAGGLITGGNGGAGGYASHNGASGGSGGSAVFIETNGTSVTFSNAAGGSMIGGSGGLGGTSQNGVANNGDASGGYGGDGVYIALESSSPSTAATLLNAGSIRGGSGGLGGFTSLAGGSGGSGGAGVAFSSSTYYRSNNGGILKNTGSISGGDGAGSAYQGGNGGDGGVGVTFSSSTNSYQTYNDATLINAGSIRGGSGGSGGPTMGNSGNNGKGVVFIGGGGTLVNQQGGSIFGGVVMGDGPGSDPSYANAVTLEIGSTITGGLNISTNSASTLTLTDHGTGGTQLYSQAVQGGTTFGGSLVKTGSGTWTLDQTFSYAGPTTVSTGTLQVGNGDVTGTLGAGAVTDNAALVFNRSDALTVPNVITGSGTLTQAGSGTLTLTAANNYAGGTSVVAGTLLVASANPNFSATGSGLVTVNTGATLAGNGTIAGPVTVADGGTLAPGGNAGANGSAANVGKLTVGALTLSASATSVFDISSGATYDQWVANGNITLGGSTLTLNLPGTNQTYASGQVLDLFHANGGTLSGTFSDFANNGTYSYGGESFRANYTTTDFTLTALTSVPEPATWVAGPLLFAMAVVGLRRRMRLAHLQRATASLQPLTFSLTTRQRGEFCGLALVHARRSMRRSHPLEMLSFYRRRPSWQQGFPKRRIAAKLA